MKPQRRDFLKLGSIAVISLAALSRAARAPAQGKALAHLPESDPQAAALGYRHDATKVDGKRFANYKPGQDCDDCLQFEGKKGDAWGGCKIFPGKAVNAKGWCSAFQPKKA
jgi:high potential iron-sulfur protein